MVTCIYCLKELTYEQGFWRIKGSTITCPSRSGEGHRPANGTIPQPTNLQSKKLLQKTCNRLALSPKRVCRTLHSCIFCGSDIIAGELYRDRGYAHRAHETCLQAVLLVVK